MQAQKNQNIHRRKHLVSNKKRDENKKSQAL